jgi:DNA repair protein RadA/Sms
MAKSAKNYVCQSCGAVTSKWAGKCESCNEWNSIVEEVVEAAIPKGMGVKKGRAIEFVDLKGEDSR